MVSLSREGLHDKSNVCLSYSICNFRKNDKTAKEFLAWLNEKKMSNWKIVFLGTLEDSLLKRSFRAAFPEQVITLHRPWLYNRYSVRKKELNKYFRRNVYDSGIWNSRVLTIYGTGAYHHFTYALTRLALERRGLRNWTYTHIDAHRDSWGRKTTSGKKPWLNCANFVDQLVHDHCAVPFMIGSDCYPKQDSEGFRICGKRIPIYSNYFTKKLQQSQKWTSNTVPASQTGLELPALDDLRASPTETYLSFDLDVLGYSEIVTEYDQLEDSTLRRLCQIVDRVRTYKRVFSADILGFPEFNQNHTLSCLTMIILARKIMGLGIHNLLKYHTRAKRTQTLRTRNNCPAKEFVNYDQQDRPSPISEEELLEMFKCQTV